MGGRHHGGGIRSALRGLAVACALFCCGFPAVAAAVPTSLQTLVDATPAGGVLVLPADTTLDAAVVLRRPLTLRGRPEATTRITSPDVGFVVDSAGIRFEHLVVVAHLGIDVRSGDATLDHVGLHADLGLVVGVGAQARLATARVTCARREDSAGLVVYGSVTGVDVRIEGSCLRGIDVQRGTASFDRLAIDGALIAGVRVVDGELSLRGATVDVRGADATAVYAARSRLEVVGARLDGGQHGVLCRDSTVLVEGVSVTGAENAGFASISGTMLVRGATFTGPFSQAAISGADGARVDVEDLEARVVGRAGVTVLRAQLRLERARISGARPDSVGDFGHAVMAVEATVLVRQLSVPDAKGAGVYLSGGRATVDAVHVADAVVGVVGVLGAHGTVRALTTTPATGASLVATHGARLDVSASRLQAPIGRLTCGFGRIGFGADVRDDAKEPERTCSDADDWDAVIPRR